MEPNSEQKSTFLVSIVGNGPSRSLWDGAGMSIGCNCAEDTRLLCITDKWLIYKVMDRELRPKAPLILGPGAWREARNCNIWNKVSLVGCITKADGMDLNAGQTAALWAYRVYSGCELHLWGFDSMWTGERTTKTDDEWAAWKSAKPARGDGKKPAPAKWTRAWKAIKEKNPKILLYLHTPKGVSINTINGLFAQVEHE